MSPMNAENSLIYHTGALGDFLTTIPSLRFWKTRHKNERVVLVGKSSIGEFAKDIGLVDESYAVDDKRLLPLFLDNFSPDAEKILSPFQTAILFTAPDSPVIKNIRQSGIPSLYSQPPFHATTDKTHISDYHLSLFIDPQSLVPAEKIPFITPIKAWLKKSLTIIPERQTPVALHPGSGSKKKNWPFERFLAVADAMRKKNMAIVWLLGPAEEGVSVPSDDIVVSNQPLSLCAALLSRCRVFVGNDSGMAHLAAAVGCRTIALFGPSDPMVWAPRGKDVRIIYKQKSCSPCHPAPPSCDGGCMTAITVEEMLDEI